MGERAAGQPGASRSCLDDRRGSAKLPQDAARGLSDARQGGELAGQPGCSATGWGRASPPAWRTRWSAVSAGRRVPPACPRSAVSARIPGWCRPRSGCRSCRPAPRPVDERREVVRPALEHLLDPDGLDCSALVSVLVLSVRSPASADADGVPLPVVAPVLTPRSSMIDMPGPARRRLSTWRAHRAEQVRQLGVPNGVPWVGSVLDGGCASWVWIVAIAEL